MGEENEQEVNMDPFNGKDPLSITDPMEWAEALERLIVGKPGLELDAGLLVGWFSNYKSALEAADGK